MRRAGWFLLGVVATLSVVVLVLWPRGTTRVALLRDSSVHEGPAPESIEETARVEFDHQDRGAVDAAPPSTDGRPPKRADRSGVPWTIRGRALDAKLTLLANTSLDGGLYRIAIEPSGRERTLEAESRVGATTDALGGFQASIRLPSSPEPGTRELALVAYDRASQLEWRGFARVNLANPKEVDVGDVVLAPAPTVVAGIIVDPSGSPLKYSFVGADDPEDPGQADDDRRGRAGQTRYSGLDGRFEVPSWTRAKRLSVWAGDRDHAYSRIPDVPVPTLDLRIVVRLADTASIRFTILTDDEACGQRLCGRLRLEEDRRTLARDLRRSEHDYERKDLVFRPVDPGVYDLEIYDPLTGIVLESIAGLRVEEHLQCTDDRLSPIDLRGRFVCARVQIVNEGGRPLAYEKLPIEGPDGTSELISDREGRVNLALPPGGPVISAIGPRGARTPIADGASIVVRRD